MTYCSQCGKKSAENALFCMDCGSPIKAQAPASVHSDSGNISPTSEPSAAPLVQSMTREKDYIFGGQAYPITVEACEVVSSDKHYITEVSSSQGLPDANGNRRTSIGSYTTEKQEIWYKTSDEKEHSLKLEEGQTAAVRVGHKILIIRVQNRKYNSMVPTAIVNQSTRNSGWITEKDNLGTSLAVDDLSLGRLAKHILLVVVIVAVVTILTGNSVITYGVMYCIGYLIYQFYSTYALLKKFNKSLIVHINQLCKQMNAS